MAQGPQHAMTPQDGADALAKASKALSGAKSFTKSVEGSEASKIAAKPKPTTSNAAPAPKPKPKSEAMGEAESVGQGIRSNIDTMSAVQESMPKYHKGGKVKETGAANVQKNETVLPAKNKKRATELAMKHLDGMKDGMEHEAAKRVKPMHKKKHGKVRKMHVNVNDDNTFSMTHEHHPMEDGSSVPDTTHSAPDMDGLIDHMQQHMGEPNPGEAAASAPAPAAGGAPAV